MKRFLALVLALVLCLAVFAGCTPSTDESSSEKPSSVDSVDESSDVDTDQVDISVKSATTIKSVTMFGPTDAAGAAYADGIVAFNAKDNNITVEDESEQATPAWKTAISTDFSSGNEPDVIFYFTESQAKPLYGKVVSIDTIKEVYPDYGKNITEAAMTATESLEDGVNYALPIKGFWEALYVNKQIFADNNLELPTDWDKLITACETLSAAGIVPIAQGFKDEPHYLIEAIIAAGAGSEYGAVPKSAADVPASWITGLNGLKLLADAGAFGSNEASLAHGDAMDMIAKGEAAMFVEGSWKCGYLEWVEIDENNKYVRTQDTESTDPEVSKAVPAEDQITRNFTVMAMPAMPGGNGGNTICAGFTSGWYITQKAWDESEDKRNACIQYVDYMTSMDVMIAMLQGSAPAFEYTPTEGYSTLQQEGLTLVANSDYFAPIDARIATTAWDSLWKNAIKVLNGSETAEKILGDAMDLNE